MKLLTAFMRLIRWPNLVFIVLTQFLFYYCIQLPIFNEFNIEPALNVLHWGLLSLSSVLIAAAGYIINDYFDLNIDRINKPDKLIVERHIKRRWALMWHIILSAVGIALGFYVDAHSPVKLLGFANIICVILLFAYSISLKKKLLSGNILISLLTAWTVFVIAFCESINLINYRGSYGIEKYTRLTVLYGAFAFIISLIREVVKDMEDIEGDRKYGCTTMPIVWGVNASKIYTAVWLIVLIVLLAVIQVYVLQFKWYISAVYCILFIVLPLIRILRGLFKATEPRDYHKISSAVKMVMLTGILSMVFFKIYV